MKSSQSCFRLSSHSRSIWTRNKFEKRNGNFQKASSKLFRTFFHTHKKNSKQRNEKMKKSAQIMLIACSEILSSSRSFHCQSHSSTLIWETKGEQSKRESIWGFIKSWIRAKNGEITKKRHSSCKGKKVRTEILFNCKLFHSFIWFVPRPPFFIQEFLWCALLSFISINRQERT